MLSRAVMLSHDMLSQYLIHMLSMPNRKRGPSSGGGPGAMCALRFTDGEKTKKNGDIYLAFLRDIKGVYV